MINPSFIRDLLDRLDNPNATLSNGKDAGPQTLVEVRKQSQDSVPVLNDTLDEAVMSSLREFIDRIEELEEEAPSSSNGPAPLSHKYSAEDREKIRDHLKSDGKWDAPSMRINARDMVIAKKADGKWYNVGPVSDILGKDDVAESMDGGDDVLDEAQQETGPTLEAIYALTDQIRDVFKRNWAPKPHTAFEIAATWVHLAHKQGVEYTHDDVLRGVKSALGFGNIYCAEVADIVFKAYTDARNGAGAIDEALDEAEEEPVTKTRSILPNSSPDILEPLKGKHGTLEVRWNADLYEHALFYKGPKGEFPMVTHHNGHSCHNMAKRIIAAWEDKIDPDYAMKQYKYILDCGGLGISAERMKEIIERGV